MTRADDAGGERRGSAWATPEEKAAYLDGAASLDARLPEVRQLAERFARAHAEGPEGLARALHRAVRDGIEYRPDNGGSGREELADAGVVLRRGYDDCDGKSRTLVALCRAAGLEARIRPVFIDGRHFSHVQAEIRWPGSERIREAEPGGWLLAEVTIRGVPLGGDPRRAPRDQKGRRYLAGPPGTVRPLDQK